MQNAYFTRICRHPIMLAISLATIFCLLMLLPIAKLSAQSGTTTSGAESTAVVRGHGAILLDEGGRAMKATLDGGVLVTLVGRSPDNALLYVRTEADESGWVAAGSLLTAGIMSLPIRQLDDTTSEVATLPSADSTQVTTTITATGSPSDASTPILIPTPTPAADGINTATAGITVGITARVTLTDSRLNLRAGPGTSYPIVTKADPGSTWQVTGRSEAGDWLQVKFPGASTAATTEAWASATYFTITTGTLTDAPIVSVIVLIPTPAPAIASTSSASNATQSATTSASAGKTGLTGTLVFQDRIGGTIYVYELSTDTLRPLTSGVDPAISPDGRMVAFTRDGGGTGLYVINIDGSDERMIFGGYAIFRSPKWSPDGQFIVFSRSAGHNDCRVIEGGVCLPDDAIWDSLPPELQSGEAKNALRGLPNYREYYFALSVVDPNGEGFRDVPSLMKAQAPDWNEAGIAYFSSVAGIQITADAGDARSVEVANDAILGYFQDPDWQPNGGRIAFHRQMNGQHWQIFLVNPDGTGLTAITRPVTALVDELPSNVSPTWSPDGQHIVYLSNRNSIESAGAWHLWVMNADGSNQRMLPIDVPLDYTFSAEQVVSWGR